MSMRPRYTYAHGPDGSYSLNIQLTALPCPGMALHLNTVIDCTPGNAWLDRIPPITIDFLNKLPQQSEAPTPASAVAAQLTRRFTCSTGDFVRQLQRVEPMVTAAGLPLECVPSVEEFIHLSVSSNSFYKAVAITVEAGASVDDEDEELPPGAVVGECAICYKEYLVDGPTSVKLACNHTFHRRCLDRWTAVYPTCPYCRAPVPVEQDYWDDEDDCDDSESGYDDVTSEEGGDSELEYDVPNEEDDGSSPAPDGDNLNRPFYASLI
ncbi:hypothetical protein ZEAMMB73_Zm00001d017188 [Zea mays]|uniref:Uncharacterized protein n=1 Tax=Zea mays TaxID=4577 RepID=A0A1D6HCW7_MAIZE|nr:hypothetical protein ZEAMMB73_Zm00001d017188 [Zea mays]